jgi:hypothetical protein
MAIKDLDKLGTNTDASKISSYCMYCFQNGEFTQPDFTLAKMQKFCIENMKEMGFPELIAWLFTRSIPKLKRWTH